MYVAAGHNENKCFVIPEWGMVVVRMGSGGEPKGVDEVWSEFSGKVGQAPGR